MPFKRRHLLAVVEGEWPLCRYLLNILKSTLLQVRDSSQSADSRENIFKLRQGGLAWLHGVSAVRVALLSTSTYIGLALCVELPTAQWRFPRNTGAPLWPVDAW